MALPSARDLGAFLDAQLFPEVLENEVEDDVVGDTVEANASRVIGEWLARAEAEKEALGRALGAVHEAPAAQALAVNQRAVERIAAVLEKSKELLEGVERGCHIVAPFVEKVGPYLEQLEVLRNAERYVRVALLVATSAAPFSIERLDELCEAQASYREFLDGTGKELHLGGLIAAKIEQGVLELRNRLEKRLRTCLNDIGWPITPTNPSLRLEKVGAFQSALSELFLLDCRHGTLEFSKSGKEVIGGLGFVDILAEPLVQRFKYHFSGNRSTNRLDRPDWYHNFILDAIRQHCSFLTEFVQPLTICSDFFVDTVRLFISSLVKALVSMLGKKWPRIQESRALICSTVDQSVSLDHSLSVQFMYPRDALRVMSFYSSHLDSIVDADLYFAHQRVLLELGKPSAWSTLLDALNSDVVGERMAVAEVCDHFLSIVGTLEGRAKALFFDDQSSFFDKVLVGVARTFTGALEDRLSCCVERVDIITVANSCDYLFQTLSEKVETDPLYAGKLVSVMSRLEKTRSACVQKLVDPIWVGFVDRCMLYLRAVEGGSMCTGVAEPVRSPQLAVAIEGLQPYLVEFRKLRSKVSQLAVGRLTLDIHKLLLLPASSRFDEHGGARFFQDCQGLFSAFQDYSKNPGNRFFRELKDMSKLLCSSGPSLHSFFLAVKKLSAGWDRRRESPEGVQLYQMLEDGYGISSLGIDRTLQIIQMRRDVKLQK